MKQKKLIIIGTSLIILILSFMYFALITPTVPFDGDDWRYIGAMRLPIPLWGAWNPTRVLPETLMPICGYIAAFIIYPVSGNYVGALTISTAIVIAFFVTGMFYCFFLFLEKRLKLTWKESLISQVLFFLSFFLLFKKINQESYSMFWTGDLACDFYYLIPGLLNAIVILIILQSSNFSLTFRKLSNLRKGLFLIALYFAIFSNTQLSIILATVCFVKFIETTWDLLKGQKELFTSQSWKQYSFYVVTLVLWLLTIIFDLHGARARMVQGTNQGSLSQKINITFNQFRQFVETQNKYFLLVFTVIILSAIVLCIYKKQAKVMFVSIISGIISMIISLIYLLLAYIQAGGTYAARPDAMWAVAFFFLFSTNVGLACLIKYTAIMKMTWPLILILLSIVAFNFNYQPLPPSNAAFDAKTKVSVDNYIIKQIVKADRAGKASVVVNVPQDQKKVDPKITGTNWPHSYDMEKWMQNTLYIHHIIRSRIQITFKPDQRVNKKLYENKDRQQPIVPAE